VQETKRLAPNRIAVEGNENIKTYVFRYLAWWTSGSIELLRGLLRESVENRVGCKFVNNELPCPSRVRVALFVNLLPAA
jgi:hypothetical protein